MAGRRKVANVMALAVLGTVSERPMHPYEIASVMRARDKDRDMAIKWGSLYRVVQNLAKHGFLRVAQSERAGGRPERTVYEITDAGRAELVDWVRELLAEPGGDYTAGLSMLGVLGPDDVARQLRRRVDALTEQLAADRAAYQAAASQVPRLFLIEDEYGLAARTAELTWTRALLAEITEGTLPGLAQWREYHGSGEPAERTESAGPDGPAERRTEPG